MPDCAEHGRQESPKQSAERREVAESNRGDLIGIAEPVPLSLRA